MALSPEQNATLQLLLERRRTYAELAELLQADESEIRARARSALAELGGADPDREVGLTDYLLGQADPIGRADAVRHLRDDPEAHRLVSELAARLREIYPDAELPRLPGEPRPPRRARLERPAAGDGETAAGALSGRLSLDRRQSRILAVAGGGAILLIAAVLAITGAFGGDGEDGSSDSATTSAETPQDEQAVPVRMNPVGGSDAGGVIVIGFATADQPFVEFQLRNLQQPTADDAYVMWFRLPDGKAYPIPAALPVDAQGRVADRIAVPAAVISVALEADSIAIALNDRSEFNRAVDRALAGEQVLLDYPGGTVLEAELRGQVPGAEQTTE